MDDSIKCLVAHYFPEWGKYLGVEAKGSPVPIYQWEHGELHKYEAQAMLKLAAAKEWHGETPN